MRLVTGLLVGSLVGGAVAAVLSYTPESQAGTPRTWRDVMTGRTPGATVCLFPTGPLGSPILTGYRATVSACVGSSDPQEALECRDVNVVVPPEHAAKAKAVLTWGLTQAAAQRNLSVNVGDLP